jgi:hypothetical protein
VLAMVGSFSRVVLFFLHMNSYCGWRHFSNQTIDSTHRRILHNLCPFCMACSKVYVENILALQAKANDGSAVRVELPLAIMTSGDTHDRTLALLEANDYFGASRSQITLLKQEKVVASWQSTHLFVHLSLLCRVAGRPCAMGCVSIHVPYCQLMHEAIKLHLASFALGCNNWSSRSQVAACMERVQSESHMHSLPPFPRLRAMFLYVSLLRLHPCPVLQTGRWRAWRTTMRGLP